MDDTPVLAFGMDYYLDADVAAVVAVEWSQNSFVAEHAASVAVEHVVAEFAAAFAVAAHSTTVRQPHPNATDAHCRCSNTTCYGFMLYVHLILSLLRVVAFWI